MLIKRTQYLENIRRFYESNLIKVLTGIRRCGKSVLLSQIKDELVSECGISKDHIISIKSLEEVEDFEIYRKELEEMKKHLWGVSFSDGSLETVEFTLHHESCEEHIYRRLLREKRCGYVERLNENTSRFYAEVYDVKEMIPWIRTFICRIQSISLSNKEVENQFKRDLEEMYRYYEEEEDDIS